MKKTIIDKKNGISCIR